jgi:hypothetical protein
MMSEERADKPMEEEAETPSQEPMPEEEPQARIEDELQEFGRQLTNATRAILESPEAKELGTQLQRGLDSLGKTVDRLADQARETKVGQRVDRGVNEAAEAVRERRVAETAADALANALRAMNRALGQVAERAERHTQEAKSAPKQIEIMPEEEEEKE